MPASAAPHNVPPIMNKSMVPSPLENDRDAALNDNMVDGVSDHGE